MEEYTKLIDSYLDEMIKSLQGCIRIPSVQGEALSGAPYGEEPEKCLEYMLSLAEKMGFSVGRMDGHAGWCEYGDQEEMVAVLAHLDVVPAGDGWNVPPFEGRVTDDKIYGRGSMDDKGPAIAALYALFVLKESGVPLKRRVRMLFGLNEETGSADMKYYLAHGGEVPVMGITPDGEYPVINGEKGLITQSFSRNLHQSGDIRLIKIEGGSAHNIVPDEASASFACSLKTAEQIQTLAGEPDIFCTKTPEGVCVRAKGVSAHGASPQEGENAIGRLMLFLNTLPLEGDLKEVTSFFAEKFKMEWDGKSLGIALSDEESGNLTMNLGVIKGDENGIEVKLNYRYPVTCTFEECYPIVVSAFSDAGFKETFLQHKKALYMAPDCPLVQTLLKVYEDYTGQEAHPKCIGGGTYAKMIPNILAFGPIFPGDEVREHKPDEYLETGRLLDNAKILCKAIEAISNL